MIFIQTTHQRQMVEARKERELITIILIFIQTNPSQSSFASFFVRLLYLRSIAKQNSWCLSRVFLSNHCRSLYATAARWNSSDYIETIQWINNRLLFSRIERMVFKGGRLTFYSRGYTTLHNRNLLRSWWIELRRP